MRERPLRERRPKKKIEDDEAARVRTVASLIVPPGEHAFRDGYRECVEMFALHAPNRRGVGRILDEHCVTLEQDCMRTPSREHYARYEGYRAAVKELRRSRKVT